MGYIVHPAMVSINLDIPPQIGYACTMPTNECTKCEMSLKDPIFWDTHQTMVDGHIWCVESKTTRIDDLTKSILDKYENK